MKKLTTLCAFILCFTIHSLATGIRFIENKNWKELLALAKKENKLIFLDAYATWCGPCKYMKTKIFIENSVGSFYNDKFINVQLDMETGEGPVLAEKYDLTAYPTLFFINGNGEVVHKYVGALEASEFITLGKNALDPKKQFYSLHKLALKGKLSPADFHQWLHDAESLDKEIADSTITAYLKQAPHTLLDKDMLSIIFDHAETVSNEQLNFLFAHKQEVGNLLDKPDKEVDEALLKKLRSYALTTAMKENEMDFAVFRKIIEQHFPDRAVLETNKMQVNYYFFMEETEKAMDALFALLDKENLPAFDLATLFMGHAEKIVSSNRVNELLIKLINFKLSPSESKQDYYKDVALLAVYMKAGNQTKKLEYAAKIIDNVNTPEELKKNVIKIRDEANEH